MPPRRETMRPVRMRPGARRCGSVTHRGGPPACPAPGGAASNASRSYSMKRTVGIAPDGAAVLVRRGLPAVELAVVARGELLEAVAEAGDVGVVDPQLARRAQRPLDLLAGGLER